MIKCRPILFSCPMVCAILEGRKTQTRRIVKPQPPDHAIEVFDWRAPEIAESAKANEGCYFNDMDGLHFHCKCPYGTIGDRLWVRESFCVAELYSYGTDPSGEEIIPRGIPRGPVHYKANGNPKNTPNRHYPSGLRNGKFAAPDPYAIWVSRPSIYMPRWASRITLEITGVRVERLNDISEDDARGEGAELYCRGSTSMSSFRWGFAELWDSINGSGSWEINPFVWVIEFKQIEQRGEQ